MGSKIKLFSFRGFIKAIGVKLVSKFVSMAVGRNYSYGRQTSLTSLTMKSLIKMKILNSYQNIFSQKRTARAASNLRALAGQISIRIVDLWQDSPFETKTSLYNYLFLNGNQTTLQYMKFVTVQAILNFQLLCI